MRTKLKIINEMDDEFIIDGEEPDMERKVRRERDSFEPKVEYLGKLVEKRYFRVFVYGKDDKQKLCNSYDEFVKDIFSGDWFESKEALLDSLHAEFFGDIADEKPVTKERKKPGPKPKVKVEEDLPNDEVIEYGADR